MNNMIIGLGNTGTNIVKAAAASNVLGDVTMYTIDSVTSSIDLDSMDKINVIPIISDEKAGSGRNRERGKAMYKFHESNGAFDKMYEDAANSKTPVIVITSSAGGTGSGSAVPVCEALIMRDIQVIPIIVCPHKDDPMAFHLNTTDLFIELDEAGVETYSIFENRKGDADYGPVNKEVVNLIEIIFGKHYGKTDLDSIDDSDLDVILSTPGRFIAVSAESTTIPTLTKEITRKVFNGFQPAWSPNVKNNTIITAYSLTSMFAETDFKNVFGEINSRIGSGVYDEYRNIVSDDNDGVSVASIIVAGLPRSEMKQIDTVYKAASSIGDGIKKASRPEFMNRKKATVVDEKTPDGTSGRNKFNWRR